VVVGGASGSHSYQCQMFTGNVLGLSCRTLGWE